jgi:hypothetical protein
MDGASLAEKTVQLPTEIPSFEKSPKPTSSVQIAELNDKVAVKKILSGEYTDA